MYYLLNIMKLEFQVKFLKKRSGIKFNLLFSDFGLARITSSSENETFTMSGPLKHMAPECLLQRKYSEKSDIWAYGVTLHEIFASQKKKIFFFD